MHVRIPIGLPPRTVKPLVVFVRRRGRGCCGGVGCSMGPRRRKQLIASIGLIMTTMLLIQYNSHNHLQSDDIQLRFLNPALPSEQQDYGTSGERENLRENERDKKLLVHNNRGLGRHLQEEKHSQLDAELLLRNREKQRTRDVDKNVKKIVRPERTGNENLAIEPENSVNSLGSHVTIIPAHRIPVSYLKIHYCPACIGTSFCDEFLAGNVTAFQDLDSSGSRAQIPGSWNGRGVILRFPSKERIARFTEYICTNWTNPDEMDSCDISRVVMKSTFSRTDLDLSPHETKQGIFQQDDDPIAIISPTTCAYGEFFAKVRRQFHIHAQKSKRPYNSRKMASLMSSLLFDPLPVIIQFIEKEVPQLLPYFPKYLGACGHVTVVEEEGLPLINFLPDPWESRVGITLEILKFIDDLWNANSKWGFVLLDFSYKNFVVLPSGSLQLTTPEKLLVVDKEYFQDVLNIDLSANNPWPTCNKICLVTFLNELIMTNHTECSLTTNPQQFMYMMASHMLLSDLYTTQNIDFFEGKQLLDKNHPGGLLYDIPETMDAKLSQLLYECILETQGGSRTNAVRTIRRLLQIVQKGFDYKRKIEENKKKISIAHPG